MAVVDPTFIERMVKNAFGESYVSHRMTGSAYICDPPVTNTDIDVLVLVDDIVQAEKEMADIHWDWNNNSGSQPPGDTQFRTVRHGPYNLLVTQDITWYLKMGAATELCKEMNVLDKDKRIMYFTLIVEDFKKKDNNTWTKPASGTVTGIKIIASGGGSGVGGILTNWYDNTYKDK